MTLFRWRLLTIRAWNEYCSGLQGQTLCSLHAVLYVILELALVFVYQKILPCFIGVFCLYVVNHFRRVSRSTDI